MQFFRLNFLILLLLIPVTAEVDVGTNVYTQKLRLSYTVEPSIKVSLKVGSLAQYLEDIFIDLGIVNLGSCKESCYRLLSNSGSVLVKDVTVTPLASGYPNGVVVYISHAGEPNEVVYFSKLPLGYGWVNPTKNATLITTDKNTFYIGPSGKSIQTEFGVIVLDKSIPGRKYSTIIFTVVGVI